MNDYDGILCSVCRKPFTSQAWAERHTDPNDGESDCHRQHCRWCRLEAAAEKRKVKKQEAKV